MHGTQAISSVFLVKYFSLYFDHWNNRKISSRVCVCKWNTLISIIKLVAERLDSILVDFCKHQPLHARSYIQIVRREKQQQQRKRLIRSHRKNYMHIKLNICNKTK